MKMFLVSSIPLLLLITTTSTSPVSKISTVIENRETRSIWGGTFLTAVVPNAGSQPVNLDSWFCGAKKWQMKLGYDIIENMCEEKMPEINQCCAVHDSCYDNMSYRRERCDREFCNCLDTAMLRTPNLPFTCSDRITDAACEAVKHFGGSSYGQHSGPIQLESRAYHPALNQTANVEYNRLYEKCPGYGTPLTSCAYNHLVCTVKYLNADRYKQEYTDCRDQLISCIEYSSEFLKFKEKSEECFEQIQITLEAIKDDARVSGMDPSQYYVNITTTTPQLTV